MKSTMKNLLLTGLLVGLLDGIAAVVFLAKMNFEIVFKFIASGIFGKSAFEGGTEMVLCGIALHFLIAISFTGFFYFTFNRFDFLKNNKIIRGLIYGIFIWTVMNILVLPLSNTPQNPHTLIGIAKGMIIIMICVGLPISLLTKSYSEKRLDMVTS
ncbi:MAG: DUF1440 domain-containing protein [Flavobacterium sp.]